MIKYALLIAGIALYFFGIDSLIKLIRDESFSKSFIKLMDQDNNGVITAKQIKIFKPCPQYKGKIIKRIFKQFGTKADINKFAENVPPIKILKALKPCINVANLTKLLQVSYIQTLTAKQLSEQFLQIYDLNKDKFIEYSEYEIVNKFFKNIPEDLRKIFQYFDKNNDWKISQKELLKSKPKYISLFIKQGKKK